MWTEFNGQNYTIGNSVDVMKKMEEGSINLVVTSPPYGINIEYGEYNDKINFKRWKNLMVESANEIKRVLAPNGAAFINVSKVAFEGNVILLDMFIYEIFYKLGFHLKDRIIWTFSQSIVPRGGKGLRAAHEVILWFRKDFDNYTANVHDIAVVSYSTTRFKHKSRYNENGERIINPGNVWYFNPVIATKKKYSIIHPCEYPTAMIEEVIKLGTNKGETVLDPFLGSGTTLVAAHHTGRIGYGIELDTKYEPLIKERLKIECKNSLI
jgi:adenine-specific DNA-methyltransferase